MRPVTESDRCLQADAGHIDSVHRDESGYEFAFLSLIHVVTCQHLQHPFAGRHIADLEAAIAGAASHAPWFHGHRAGALA